MVVSSGNQSPSWSSLEPTKNQLISINSGVTKKGLLWIIRYSYHCLQCGRPGFDPWVRKILWRRKWQPTPVLLPGKSHGQRNLVGYIQSMGSQRVRHDWATSLSPLRGFPGSLDSKESACNAGYLGSILGLGRSPGGGHGNLLQYSCLENPHGQRSLADYSPWGCKELNTTERLSTPITKKISKVLGVLCQEPGTKIKSIFDCKHIQSQAWIPTLSSITWAKYCLWPPGSWSINTPKKKKSVSHSDVNSSDPMDCSLPRLLCPWNSPGKNTGVVSHSLLYDIFPIQGPNHGLLLCRQILYHLSHRRSANTPKTSSDLKVEEVVSFRKKMWKCQTSTS